MKRYEYRGQLDTLSGWVKPALFVVGATRQPVYADLDQLAELMIAAYRGTIDYDGETLDDARAELHTYFTPGATRPLMDHSRIYVEDGTIVAASLVAFWTLREVPLIAYVMTRPTHKQRSIGRWLVHQSLLSLRAADYSNVHAVITAGNQASERLFARLGFLRQQE